MGPLEGFKIIEIAGVGPSQFAGMLLADMGASVLRIDKPGGSNPGFAVHPRFNLMNRSRPTIVVDLKTNAGVDLVMNLCEEADALFEGFRPGVMEGLGLGPAECMQRNPRLVYGRITGWGQRGPLADSAGHDPNYIALSGVYSAIGEKEGGPVYPLNLVGDMGGGGAYLVIGLLAAMLEAGKSGQGQIVDAAMIDGAASQLTAIHGLVAAGVWKEGRGRNLLDGGAPFARAYRTLDDRHIAIAPLENRFFRLLLNTLGIHDFDPADQYRESEWEDLRRRLEAVFKTRTRDEWCELLEGTDACFAPILGIEEAMEHPHNVSRQSFIRVDGVNQAAPAPRFSRTESEVSRPAGTVESDLQKVIAQWRVSEKVPGNQ